jgi:hypothetical protein
MEGNSPGYEHSGDPLKGGFDAARQKRLPTSARPNIAPVCFPAGAAETITNANSPSSASCDNHWPVWTRLLPERERRLCASSSSNAKWGGSQRSDSPVQGWIVFVQPAQARNVQPPWRSGQMALKQN